LRARLDNNFEHARFPGHCAVRPAPADFIEVALLRVRTLGSGVAVEFIQFDTLSRAEVFIDGEFVGSTPSKVRVSPGERKIRISRPNYKDWERAIKI
jgi:PEGA domain